MMQKSYIILDVMSTGNIPETHGYLSYFDHSQIKFDKAHHYFEYEMAPLDLYNYKYFFIDANFLSRFRIGKEYENELIRRIKVLSKYNFIPVILNLWEHFGRHYITDPAFLKYNILTDPAILGEILKKSGVSKICVLGGNRSFFWQMMYKKYVEQGLGNYLKIDHSGKIYDFLYLNKKPREHRVHLYNQLLIANVIKNCLYTYRNNQHFYYDPTKGAEKINITLPPEYEIPEVKDCYPEYGYDQLIYSLPYNHSKINVVVETQVNDPKNLFLTEKIWKPIICRQPFIVYGQQGYLKCLRDIGFKTFSSMWDESYDDEPNSIKRGNMIANLMRSLKGIDAETLYKKTEEIRSHNYKIFSNAELLKSIITQDISNSLFRDLIKI